MSMTAGVAAGRVLRDEPLKTVSRQVPKESPVPHAALAIEGQLHAIRIRNNITVVARAAVARIFAEFSACFKIFGAPVVTIFELVRVVEQRVLAAVEVE